MLDLGATATANNAERRQSADALISADPTGVLAQFRDFVAASVLSSNVTADKVVGWDAAGQVLDTRSWCIAHAGGDVLRGAG